MADLDFLMRNKGVGDPEEARGTLAPDTTELGGLEPIEGLDSVSDVVKEVDQMPATSHGYDEKDIAKGFAFGPGYDGGGEFPEPEIKGIDRDDIEEVAYDEGVYADEMDAIPHMPLGTTATRALGVRKTPATKKQKKPKKPKKQKKQKKQKMASFGKKKSKAKSKAKAKAKKSLMKAHKGLDKALKEYKRVMKM